MGVEIENFSVNPLASTALDHTIPIEGELQADAPMAVDTSEPPAASPPREPLRPEKRESRLPLPGSRLPLKKSSNPALNSENTSSIPTPRTSKLSLVTPKAGGLKKLSPNASPIRSPGLSPGLKSQSSNGSLRSPATPTRTGLPLPKSPIGAGAHRSASMSASTLPRTLQRPSSHSNLAASKKVSGLPTLLRSPIRDSTRSVSVSGMPIAPKLAPQPTPQPKRPVLTPKLPSSRKSVSTASTLAATEPTAIKSTPAARTPLRVRSFQAPSQLQSQAPKPLTPRLATVFPKPTASVPKLAPAGSIKVPKRAPRPSIMPTEEADALDKRQRAQVSSQSLRDTIKAARAARRESNAANVVGNDWPQIVIAGIDDKKKPEAEEEKEAQEAAHHENSEEESDYEHPFGPEFDVVKQAEPIPVLPGGILDLTAKTMEEFTEEALGETDTLMVKVLLLQRNSLSTFSPVIKGFRGLYTLDLSCNSLRGEEYLSVEMEFPYLKTLLLHSNYIESLDALVKCIDAPRLNYLDVHANRLKAFPGGLSKKYGSLTTFVASDNKIEVVVVEGLEGIQVVDLMNNSIGQLPPELGLLGDKGLRELRVMGNLFRVPRRQVLEKGTEAVLEWLKERIPVRFEEVDDEEKEGQDESGEKEVREDGWDVVGRDEEARDLD